MTPTYQCICINLIYHVSVLYVLDALTSKSLAISGKTASPRVS